MKRFTVSTFFGRYLPWLFAALPLLGLICLLVQYQVDVPYQDEWSYLSLIDKSFLGELSLRDFWTQLNEHRPVFPRLIIVPLARLTHWNITYELALNVILALGSFLILSWYVLKSNPFADPSKTRWFIPIISLIVFSIQQLDSWLWGGATTPFFLSVCSAIFGIVLLSAASFRWNIFWIAVFLGIISNYSHSAGFVYWPVGSLILFWKGKTQKSKASLAWFLIFFFSVLLYSYHYAKPAHHHLLLYGLRHPGELVASFFLYLGSIFGWKLSFPAGVLGFIGFSGMSLFLFFSEKVNKDRILGFIALGFFSLGNALITGIARVGFHPLATLEPRYITISYPFWISILILSQITSHVLKVKSIFLVSSVLIVVLISGRSVASIVPFKEFSQRLREGRDELFILKNEKVLKYLHPEIDKIKTGAEILKRRRLSLFRTQLN